MSHQALNLRVFLETYDDKVIILRLSNQILRVHASGKKQCEKFSKWSEMQQKRERVENSVLLKQYSAAGDFLKFPN